MKFKEFTNPRHVYDGYFETYFIRPFFHHFADFKSPESSRSCMMSLLAWLIMTLGVTGIAMGQIGLLGPEAGYTTLIVVCSLWVLFSIVPILALVARTAHGAPDNERKPRMLGVDTMLGVSCLLFFVLGLLMMVTTLNSGVLNPNATMTDEADSTMFEEDYVTEEPIFTYQDEAPAQSESNDSLSDLNDPDIVAPDESYDPALTPTTPDNPINDSI